MKPILTVIIVAAVCAAIVFCVLYFRQRAVLDGEIMRVKDEGEKRLREAETAADMKLRETEGKLREVVAAGGAELKAKDDYIAKMEAVHTEALKRADEVHAEAIRKLEAGQAEAMKKVEEQHTKDMKLMQEQFRTSAAEILDKNSEAFSKQSSEKLNVLLKPVNEKFEEFRKKVEESDKGMVRMQTAIEEQVKAMIDQSTRVGESADNLASALTYNPKTQGDFGEMILRDILLSNGLVEGVNFICQGVMTDENGHEIKSGDGRTLIPDVLVFLPDNTTVVVDSKISLTDYLRYCDEKTEEGKRNALKAHIESIRKHINELADKDYASYIPNSKKKTSFNIMFIPNEGAFTLMLNESPRLWHEARERSVYIVSQQTLIIVLNMIQLLWKESDSLRNVESIVKSAQDLMNYLGLWMTEYDKLGKQIVSLSKTYDSSTEKLVTGRQSVIQKIKKLESLGAAPKHRAVKGSSRRSGPESVIPASLSGEVSDLQADEIDDVDFLPEPADGSVNV